MERTRKRRRVDDAAISENGSVPSNAQSKVEEVIPEISPNLLADVFRRHFEQRFRPLPEDTQKGHQTRLFEDVDRDEESSGSELEEDEDDWNGFGSTGDEDEDDRDADEVEIIEHTNTYSKPGEENKSEARSFMSPKPPPRSSITPRSTTTAAPKSEADKDESLNLKHDLELQRLLSESHLLRGSDRDMKAHGAARHQALDLRLQSLGAKASIFADRRRIPNIKERRVLDIQKREAYDTRRREAKEAGIILEAQQMAKTDPKKKRRERGVGGPAVGKMRRGVLTLSRRDVDSIEGRGARGGVGQGGQGGRKRTRGR